MASRTEKEAYRQAFDLVTALHQVNKYEVNETVTKWLESESDTSMTAEDAPAPNHSRIYEGIFKAIQSAEEIGPDRLWIRAQKKTEDAANREQKDGKTGKIPIVHRRLLRLYWMVHAAAEELIGHNPRIRLGKILVDVERNLREAFVETEGGIKLPLPMLRKKQWELLAKYGMGLTVDEIYDLSARQKVIEWSGGKTLFVGIVIGVVVGFILALMIMNPPAP